MFVADASSQRGAIRQLTGFAEERNCPWILVSTRDRTGIARLFRGEFAEGLVAESRCSVLSLTRLPQLYQVEIHRALFGTDLSHATIGDKQWHAVSVIFLHAARKVGEEPLGTFPARIDASYGFMAQNLSSERTGSVKRNILSIAKNQKKEFLPNPTPSFKKLTEIQSPPFSEKAIVPLPKPRLS